jgi:hypothetical protein
MLVHEYAGSADKEVKHVCSVSIYMVTSSSNDLENKFILFYEFEINQKPMEICTMFS